MYHLHLGKGGNWSRESECSVQPQGRRKHTRHAQREMGSNREEEREGGGGSIIHEGNSSTTQPPQTHAVSDKVTAETRVGNGMPKISFLGAESREALSPSLPGRQHSPVVYDSRNKLPWKALLVVL